MGLLIACVGAILACIPHGMFYGWIEPKLVCIVIGLAISLSSRHGIKINRIAVYAVAWYCAFMAPSMFLSIDQKMSIIGFPGFFSWCAMSTALCACGFICATREDSASKDMIVRGCMCAGMIMAADSFLQQFGADPLKIGHLPMGRSVGTSGSPIDMAAMFIVLLSYSPNPMLLLGLWGAKSRGAWLAVPVCVLPRGKFEGGIRAALFSMALAAGILGTIKGIEPRDILRRECWNAAIENITAFGSGPATYGYTFIKHRTDPKVLQIHAHNSILDTLSTRGIFGLFGLLALLIAPELAGLWLVCMFNPVSFEVTFVACVLAGLHLRHKDRKEAA